MRLLMRLFLLCTVYISQGQGFIAPIERLSAKAVGVDTMSINLENFYGLADSMAISTIKEKWMSDYFGDILNLNKITQPRWNLETNNFYASGQSASYFGEGLYSNLRLEHQLEIAGLPVGVFGDLILQNNQVNSRLSTIGIEFNQEALLNRYKEQLGKKAIQETFEDLENEQRQSMKENFSIQSSRKVLLSDAYQARKATLFHHIDSLRNAMQPRKDSVLLDSLQRLRDGIERTELRVDSLYNAGLSKWNETQQVLQQWRVKVLERQKVLEEKLQAGSMHEYTQKYAGKRNWRFLLLNFSQFRLGSFRIRGSPFDVSSVPLHGIGLEIRRNGYYASLNYGKEGRQQRRLPDYIRNLRLAGEGRKILHVKSGIGVPEKSHLHLAFSSIQVPEASMDTAYSTFPKRNVLISLDSKYLVSEEVFIELTGSVSNADFTGTSSTKELLGSMYDKSVQEGNNMAGLLRFGWRDKKGQSEYTVGCQTVGSNFVTLGNLFLINNRNTIRLDGKQRFLHNRGQVKISYAKGTTNTATNVTPGVQQDQFSGEISYRFNKYGSRAWVSYSPSFYLQNVPGADATVYQLNLATLGAQWVFPRGKKGQWMTMLQLTNYSDQSQYGDTSMVTGLWYGMLTQTYTSDKYSITVSANIGMDKDDLRLVRDFNMDVSQSFMMKNIQIIQGIQVVKRFYGSGLLAGGSGGIQFSIRNGLRVGFSGAYLIGVSNGEKNQLYINSSAEWQF